MVAASYFVVADTPLRRGGGEPSLASREDPYGSLRMPLSICVILRIYNEDAIRVSACSFLSIARRLLLLALDLAILPFPNRPLSLSLSLSHSLIFFLACSLARTRAIRSTQRKYDFVIVAIASIIPDRRTSRPSHDGNYRRATQDAIEIRGFTEAATIRESRLLGSRFSKRYRRGGFTEASEAITIAAVSLRKMS